MRLRRTLYGWHVAGSGYCLSRIPPDIPQAPAEFFRTIAGAEAHAEAKRKALVIWSGPALAEKRRQDARA